MPWYGERLATPRYHRTLSLDQNLLPYTYVQTPVETSAQPCASMRSSITLSQPTDACDNNAQRVESEELIRRMPHTSEPRSPRTSLGWDHMTPRTNNQNPVPVWTEMNGLTRRYDTARSIRDITE